MKKWISAVMVVMFSGWNGWAWAHEDDGKMGMTPTVFSAELQQVKRLVGSWKGTATESDGSSEPVSVEYRVTAAGSAVEERLMIGSPHEMVDMYDDEGGKLAMTHYCAMGNHPHMVLKNADARQIVLEMGPTPGIDAGKDPHMHALTLEFPDANHLTEKWTSYENGQPGGTVVFVMTRTAKS